MEKNEGKNKNREDTALHPIPKNRRNTASADTKKHGGNLR